MNVRILIYYTELRMTIKVKITRVDTGYVLTVVEPSEHVCVKTFTNISTIGDHLHLSNQATQVLLMLALMETLPGQTDSVEEIKFVCTKPGVKCDHPED